MRSLKNIFESIVKSYNNNDCINFIDLRDLDIILKSNDLVKSFIKTYNEKEKINFIQLRDLEQLTKK